MKQFVRSPITQKLCCSIILYSSILFFSSIALLEASTTASSSAVIATSNPDVDNGTLFDDGNSTSFPMTSNDGSGDTSSGDIDGSGSTSQKEGAEVTDMPSMADELMTTASTTTQPPTPAPTTKKPTTTPIPDDGFFKKQMIIGMAAGFGCFIGLIIVIILFWTCVCNKFCGDPSKKGSGRKIAPVDFRSLGDQSETSSRRRLSMSTDGTGS